MRIIGFLISPLRGRVLCYEFSKNYGHKDYLLKSNFDEKNRKEEDIEGVIEFINDAVNKQKQHEAISHYLKKHNFIPMWVLVNILTLGTVSNFYSIMKQNDRIAISKIFNIVNKSVFSILFKNDNKKN